jgi:hypothetical protein
LHTAMFVRVVTGTALCHSAREKAQKNLGRHHFHSQRQILDLNQIVSSVICSIAKPLTHRDVNLRGSVRTFAVPVPQTHTAYQALVPLLYVMEMGKRHWTGRHSFFQHPRSHSGSNFKRTKFYPFVSKICSGMTITAWQTTE